MPGLTPQQFGVPLPTGNAIEVFVINSCPAGVQALDKGAAISIARSKGIDYQIAKDLAENWDQQGALARHLRGEVPKNVTAARGDSYWHLSEEYYGSGRYWLAIAQDNRWRDLVPGASVNLPAMQDLLFGLCHVRQRESLWKAAKRLKLRTNTLISVDSTTWLGRPNGNDSIYPLERLRGSTESGCTDTQ